MNGLQNVGNAVGNYERARLARRGGLIGMAAQYLPSGVKNAPMPPPSMPDAGATPTPDMQAPPVMDNPPQPSGAMSQDDSGQIPTPMGMGRIVTKPTTAVLAEQPGTTEIVIPMNSNPDNKTSLSMLSPMSRYRR
jgi:hypothetical protein